MVSRFTLDSATDFLFGKDICSLSAGLPYPSYSPLSESASVHPSNVFASAFSTAQSITALRSRYGMHWPLFEFWKDSVKEHMDIIHDTLNPILTEAVAKKKAARAIGEVKADKDREVKDGENLLEHLVNYTDGHCFCICRTCAISLMPFTFRSYDPAGRDS